MGTSGTLGTLAALAALLAGCGDPSSSGAQTAGSTGGGSGGAASAGASGKPGAGGSAQATIGGATAQGGEPAFGGATASAGGPAFGGQAGGTSGGAGQGGTNNGGSGAIGGSGTGGASGAGGRAGTGGQRAISFGTLLDAQTVVSTAQQLAKTLADPSSAQWQAKGDQHRKYRFAAANADEPYRLYVPTNWDGKTKLPLAMFLHGSGADENTYVDQNGKQLLNLAQQRGYLLVAPLGDKGAYGNFLRLAAPFGKPDEAAKLVAQITADSERTNELSEQDVINVLELVLAEYPIDREAMFLFGHSMGSGGTWYLGGKYASYWRGLAPMSGPFVQETGYPWDGLRNTPLYVTEGTQTPSVDASRALRDWLKTNAFKAEYNEVNADHGGMISLVLPAIYDFFDRSKPK
jgi:predicted esterase